MEHRGVPDGQSDDDIHGEYERKQIEIRDLQRELEVAVRERKEAETAKLRTDRILLRLLGKKRAELEEKLIQKYGNNFLSHFDN